MSSQIYKWWGKAAVDSRLLPLPASYLCALLEDRRTSQPRCLALLSSVFSVFALLLCPLCQLLNLQVVQSA